MNEKCDNCGKCCLETEMILSQQDIYLIIESTNLNLKKHDFVFKNTNGHYQLKIVDNYCVFLDYNSKNCNIYESRPQGCRFYPLIYDIDKKKCKLDADCPRNKLFYKTKGILEDTCYNLKKFLKEQINLEIS